MGVEDLMKLCDKLSRSQGFYSRLAEELAEADIDELGRWDRAMKEANLKNELDIILWLEG